MQASEQDSLLRGAAANIDHGVEQIGPALAALSAEKQSVCVCYSNSVKRLREHRMQDKIIDRADKTPQPTWLSLADHIIICCESSIAKILTLLLRVLSHLVWVKKATSKPIY